MIVSTSVRAEFERRSARADALPPSPILSFVSLLCRAQGAIAAGLESSDVIDIDHLLPLTESFLRVVADRGPEELVVQALARLDDDAPTARARLMTYWNGDVTARDDYLSRAILRPYAEVLRARGATLDRLHNPGHCPFCGGAPMISTRREIPDAAEAAMRMLHCGLCGLEWKFNRACCPACAEEKPDKLPVYKSDAHPAVRIEACETCGRYVKSIDLTMDARPIAEIDDVVSLSMDLWAIDEGLTRIEPGLAGV